MPELKTKIFNRATQKRLRQHLRNHRPEPEKILWRELRASQLGFKFRRQHGIGKYIVDFYCSEKKLVVEIDGDSHYQNGQQRKDNDRDTFINSLEIKVLRFTNDEVMKNLEGVLEILLSELKT